MPTCRWKLKPNKETNWFALYCLTCLLFFLTVVITYSKPSTLTFTKTGVEHNVKARITCYSDYGTMADGHITHPGALATSDRTIPFGTNLYISGAIYTVEDRTAKYVDKKFKYHTLDIYQKDCKGFGVKIKYYKQKDR